MRARLLYRDRDFDWEWALQAAAVREARRTGRRYQSQNFDPHADLPRNEEALVKDLELNTLFIAMAGDDDCIFEVARKVLLASVKGDLDTIVYRQELLQDSLNRPAIVRELYAVAVEAAEKEKQHYLGGLAQHPDYVLRWSIVLLETLLGLVMQLRRLADSHADKFVSKGWTAFFAMVRNELSDDYIAHFHYHLAHLKFRDGMLLSTQLGKGNKDTGYVLHLPPGRKGTWLMRLIAEWQPTPEAGPDSRIIGPSAAIAHRAPIRLHRTTRPTLAHLEHLSEVSGGFSPCGVRAVSLEVHHRCLRHILVEQSPERPHVRCAVLCLEGCQGRERRGSILGWRIGIPAFALREGRLCHCGEPVQHRRARLADAIPVDPVAQRRHRPHGRILFGFGTGNRCRHRPHEIEAAEGKRAFALERDWREGLPPGRRPGRRRTHICGERPATPSFPQTRDGPLRGPQRTEG